LEEAKGCILVKYINFFEISNFPFSFVQENKYAKIMQIAPFKKKEYSTEICERTQIKNEENRRKFKNCAEK